MDDVSIILSSSRSLDDGYADMRKLLHNHNKPQYKLKVVNKLASLKLCDHCAVFVPLVLYMISVGEETWPTNCFSIAF